MCVIGVVWAGLIKRPQATDDAAEKEGSDVPIFPMGRQLDRDTGRQKLTPYNWLCALPWLTLVC